MRYPSEGDGSKRYWVTTYAREFEALRGMCAYFMLYGNWEDVRNAKYQTDFEVATMWLSKNKGIFNYDKQQQESDAKG